MRRALVIGIIALVAMAASAFGRWVYAGQWGHTGSGPGEFNNPSDVGLSPSGNVYTIETGNKRVQYFSSNYQYLGEWAGPFVWPEFVDCADNGNVTVVDYFSGVMLFSPTGSCIATWQFSEFPWDLHEFYGLAVSPHDGYVYTSLHGHTLHPPDNQINRVYIFDASLHEISHFDVPYSWPTIVGPIAYSPTNAWLDLYESNYGVPMKAYYTSGSLLFSWGSYGPAPGSFYGVSDMAIAPNGDLYIVEGCDRFQWFTATGSFLGYYAASGSGDGEFRYPQGIGLSPSGDTVYIADTDNDRIQYFHWENDTNITPASLGKIKALFR